MRYSLPLLLFLLLFAAAPAVEAQTGREAGEARNGRRQGIKMDCDAGPGWCNNGKGTCTPETRGRCGKRRGDWYGARQPVADAAEALALLLNYFSGQGLAVSEVSEKKWGFKADILDKDGNVVDRVMIDKRSGRIRSLH